MKSIKYIILILLVITVVSFAYSQALDIRITIQRNQIHHWVDVPVYDGEGNQTGTKEVLELGIKLPEYPNLPTYGVKVNYPITQQKVLDAIEVKLLEVKAQIERDELIRQQIEVMGYLDFKMLIGD